MALFKIYKGKKEYLPSTLHEGYVYFITDEGCLYVDISDEERVKVNGFRAYGLIDEDGEEIEVENLAKLTDLSQLEEKIDEKLKKIDLSAATTKAYEVTLEVGKWQADSGNKYKYEYENAELTCGNDGNVPPIITVISGQADYDLIESAEATAKQGIEFITSSKPAGDIKIIIIDNK